MSNEIYYKSMIFRLCNEIKVLIENSESCKDTIEKIKDLIDDNEVYNRS